MRSNIGQESNIGMQTDCLDGLGRIMDWESPPCVPPAAPQVVTVTGSRHGSEQPKDVNNEWSLKNVAQAQGQNRDTCPVVGQLSRELKKLTAKEFQPLSQATREIWAQWELLELREGVLYLQSAKGTLSAEGRMDLTQKLV